MNHTELRALIRERAPHGLIGCHDGTLEREGNWTWQPASQRQQEREGSWLYDDYLSPAQLEKRLVECECGGTGKRRSSVHGSPGGFRRPPCPSCTEIRKAIGLA